MASCWHCGNPIVFDDNVLGRNGKPKPLNEWNHEVHNCKFSPYNDAKESALDNLHEIELDLDTTGAYFKPKSGTTYEVEIDIEKHRIVPVESDRFKDIKGNPLKQYQFIVRHVGNNVEQKWSVTSKLLLRQIMGEIRKNRKVFRITRTGEDRSTTYQIEGVSQ